MRKEPYTQQHVSWPKRATVLAALWMLGMSGGAAAMAPPPATKAHFSWPRQSLVQRAASVPVGGALRLAGVPVEARTVALVLERFEVFTADARIEVQGPAGTYLAPLPQRTWFRGSIAEEPESLAFLSVGKDAVHGLILSRERLFVLGTVPEPPSFDESLVVRAVEETSAKTRAQPWKCALDELPGRASGGHGFRSMIDDSLDVVTAPATAQYSIKIAIETDYELYSLFGSVGAAAAYIGDLFGAISTIYHRDLATTLRLNYISLWTAGGSSDPWASTSAGGTLDEVRLWWGSNRPPALYPRAITHLLSGKNLGGGVAYLGVLCNASFGYGVTGNINGSFNPAAPSAVWDINAVAHEIGHNFNSDHTHCYLPEVDRCHGTEQGCYAGSSSLPAGGKGSIMSYCHLLGGDSAIALSLGQVGLYGTQSERVPQVMKNHVAGRTLSCRGVVDAPPADFNGDGRSEIFIYRNGAWLEFPFWSGR